jgi:hypothetical protein
VVGRLFDRVPVDSVSIAQVSVLNDGNCSGVDLIQRPQTQGLERGFHDVQRREHLGQSPSTNVLQISVSRTKIVNKSLYCKIRLNFSIL